LPWGRAGDGVLIDAFRDLRMNENFSSPEDNEVFPLDSRAGLDGIEDAFHDDTDAGPEADGASAGIPAETYWGVSRTPLTSLVFSLPLVAAYEGGVLLLGRGTPRNGADVWLRHLLDGFGFGAYFLLPVLWAIGLLAWHHVVHERWRCSGGVLLGMAAESLLWAFLLIGLARLQERMWPLDPGWATVIRAAAPGPLEGLVERFVGYCGAGLYEEVLFRLLLLPAVIWLLDKAGLAAFGAAFWGVLLTSLLFSAAHYVGPLGDSFAVYSFVFRTIAGIFFSIVFLVRGFGIAAGTHAAYDFLVGLL
jgi:hypothetical protein